MGWSSRNCRWQAVVSRAAVLLVLWLPLGAACGQNPATVYVYDTNQSTFELDSLMASIAGHVARDTAELFMAEGQANHDGDPEFWLDRFREFQPATSVVWRNDIAWYLQRYRQRLNGYVVYDGATINQATSVAGALGAVMVHQSLLGGSIGTALQNAGLSQVEDVRGRSDGWVYDSYRSSFNRELIFRQQPSFSHQLRDFAVLHRGFVFDETGAERDRFLAGQNQNSRVFGWGYQNDEDEFFRSASRQDLMAVPADHLRSAAAPARWSVNPPAEQGHRADPHQATEPGKHYVAFVMSDGDNVQWLTNDFARSPRWFGSPHRGTFPMTFDYSPSLLDVHPVAHRYLYEQAAADAQPTRFITAGGWGINYPSQVNDIAGFMAVTSTAMAAVDQQSLSVLDVSYDLPVLRQMAADPQMLGLMVKTGPAYAGRRGAIDWHEGKPIVSVKYTLWDGFDTPNSIIAALNSGSRDPFHDPGSYSIVNVHPWSVSLQGGGQGDPMSNVDYIIQQLADNVSVVTLDDLMIQLRNNFGAAVGNRWGTNRLANGDFEVAVVDGQGQPTDRPRDWFYATAPGATAWVDHADSDGKGTRAVSIAALQADWRSHEFAVRPGERLSVSLDFQFEGVPDGSGFRADVRFFDQPGASAGFVGESTWYIPAAEHAGQLWHTLSNELLVPEGAGFGDVRVSTFFGAFEAGRILLDNVHVTPGWLGGRADFDGDGRLDCADIDALVQQIAAAQHGAIFDLDGDGRVDRQDLDVWLETAGYLHHASQQPYLIGDANLDGAVDTSDFNIWNSHKFSLATGWCTGDFSADGVVDASDFNLWNGNKFTSVQTVAVPEPLAAWVAPGLACMIAARRRRRRPIRLGE